MMPSLLALGTCLLALSSAQAARLDPGERASTNPDSKPSKPTWGGKKGAAQGEEWNPSRIIVKYRDGSARSSNTLGIAVVPVPDGEDVNSTVAEVMRAPDVEYAEPDWVVTLDRLPNDPLFPRQWGHSRVGLPAAWDSTVGTTTLVCHIDSGIDYNHPDISPNMARAVGFNALTDVEGDPMDDLSHGTHTAGIMGARGGNGITIAGAAWRLKILACKFMDSRGVGYVSDAVQCIQYCTTKRARVIQASWSAGGYSQALRDAIVAAGAANILFVGSAGNRAADLETSPSYPASYKLGNQITVASSGYADELSYFSNWGNTTVHLAAPGEDILSTVPGDGTAEMTGTSMAAPLVSGAAALLLTESGGNLTTTQLRTLLLNSARRTQNDGLRGKVVTGGRLNVDKAMDLYHANYR